MTDLPGGPAFPGPPTGCVYAGAGDARLAYRAWGSRGARPVVLLHALGEDSCDWDRLAGMAELIPGCDLVTIPAGHRVHAARPAEFAAAVTAFLEE